MILIGNRTSDHDQIWAIQKCWSDQFRQFIHVVIKMGNTRRECSVVGCYLLEIIVLQKVFALGNFLLLFPCADVVDC